MIQRNVKMWLKHRQNEDLKHVSDFFKKYLHYDSGQQLNPAQVRRAAIRIQRKVRLWLDSIHKEDPRYASEIFP